MHGPSKGLKAGCADLTGDRRCSQDASIRAKTSLHIGTRGFGHREPAHSRRREMRKAVRHDRCFDLWPIGYGKWKMRAPDTGRFQRSAIPAGPLSQEVA